MPRIDQKFVYAFFCIKKKYEITIMVSIFFCELVCPVAPNPGPGPSHVGSHIPGGSGRADLLLAPLLLNENTKTQTGD